MLPRLQEKARINTAKKHKVPLLTKPRKLKAKPVQRPNPLPRRPATQRLEKLMRQQPALRAKAKPRARRAAASLVLKPARLRSPAAINNHT
jgi:hypothetical protein